MRRVDVTSNQKLAAVSSIVFRSRVSRGVASVSLFVTRRESRDNAGGVTRGGTSNVDGRFERRWLFLVDDDANAAGTLLYGAL